MRDRQYIEQVEKHVVRLHEELNGLRHEVQTGATHYANALTTVNRQMACAFHQWAYQATEYATQLSNLKRIPAAYLFVCGRCGCLRRVLPPELSLAQRKALVALGVGTIYRLDNVCP